MKYEEWEAMVPEAIKEEET